MSDPILTAAEMRAAEAAVIAAGTSVDTLMARAGAAVAEAAWRFAGGCPTLILCGPGNNGGDGYVAARRLRARGVSVHVAAWAPPRTDAARAARAAWDGPVVPLEDAPAAPLLIDALFGTGLTRPLDDAIAAPLDRLAAGAALRLAVDLPSGVGSDDGAVLGPVPRFDLTLALGSLKPAHLLQPAAALMGRVAVADIGVPAPGATMHRIARPLLPEPGPADHKYSRGMVAVVPGAMPGAALLAAGAAQRAGAGYVLLADEGAGGADALVRRRWSPDLLTDARIGAIVVGPGLGRDDDARARLEAALAAGRPLVLDADALALLRDRLPLEAPAVLTPHEGEFARLFGDMPGSKIERARAAARRAGAVVLLKGADSVVAAPDSRIGIAPPAPGWLASAGTGDVLAGAIGAMLAGGLPPFEAACAGLWLHGDAARRAGPALIADDLVTHLAAARGACA
ncbi:NAD(P)H-hydrate dehydratase [Sphingomonas jatrophae]|uniref:Bifunctional NAD(P)H-hydrate repair enzyme n=1 Tax=Sphingomonas jatrophae TaxID=1166337 RepID=A0A1I6JFA5_9SPHN|nr:NAD(P)H-hydrate dehydratase [Sphingomonas jatrophae]SFR77290.1 yjeF C-terminal region, hydroxyethylthiazole kinase-related/yjeF N-terminal region [Sphingomonas jatrophae]